MDPNGDQFSINDPFNNNAVACPGLTLPRSFTRAGHGNICCRAFSAFSIVLSPSQSFTRPNHEKQAYGVLINLSIVHSRTPILDCLSSASVGGNSRALVLATVRRNQTRILFVWGFIWAFLKGLTTAYQAEAELDVAYTVIRPHSALGCTFALSSDYLKDFYSFYFTKKGAFCTQFMGEFNSRTAHLNTTSNEEKNKEGLAC